MQNLLTSTHHIIKNTDRTQSTITIDVNLDEQKIPHQILWKATQSTSEEKQDTESKIEALQNALKGNDKLRALELGRLYYRWNRRDKALTVYDETAIANDLSIMKD